MTTVAALKGLEPQRAGRTDVTFRHFLSWKPLFYDVLLPALRLAGPVVGDAALGALGRSLVRAWPPRRRELARGLNAVRAALGGSWPDGSTLGALAGNVPRFLARDCQLDGTAADDAFFARFDVTGVEHLEAALAGGRGVILVGSHLGGHLSAPHWLYRRGFPLRMLIQRPQHVSKRLLDEFDRPGQDHPQGGFFLRRRLTPEEASKRIFRTRSALRDGLIIYLKGDVPWSGPNTRAGRLVGREQSFQSLWAEFAALFRAPVVAVFCTHQPGGRYRLTFDPAWAVGRGGEGEAVARYLARLDREIAAHPADAVAHLLWPCYRAEGGGATKRPRPRPKVGRRSAPARSA